MMTELENCFRHAPVVPLVQADDPDVAVKITRALVAGGLAVVEVVLRTPAAMDCLREVARAVPEAFVGAGTVLNAEQALAAIDADARFIVSPGLDDGVVEAAQARGLPVFPGTATASEVQRAWNLGIRTVKFFPAGQGGGTAVIKALGAAFQGISFMPTGGVSAANLAEYLAVPAVLACGGSWLTPKMAVEVGDFPAITELASEAVNIAQSVRA